MIQELELSISDPLVVHFKKLFEINKPLCTFTPNQYNNVRIDKEPKPYWGWGYSSNDLYIVDENLTNILSIVKNIMKKNGFESDNSTTAAVSELHYSYTNDDGIMSNAFGIHQDDNGAIDYNVNTFILYLDVACRGGELVFYNRLPDISCSCSLFTECMGESLYEPFRTINTDNPTEISCKVVMFNGSIYHKPNVISSGHRLSIVIQIPRL
jgi:hypothetical protein